MRVTYSRRLMNQFRRAAISAYPCEAYAALLARVRDNACRIEVLYIPDNQREWTTDEGFSVPQRVWDTAHRMARAAGLSFVGDIHSHPYPAEVPHDCSPSEKDWIRAREADIIHGVCSVRKTAEGRFSTRVKFWPSNVGMREVVID